ncbi:unnamed protein product [Caretta caretta]
MKMISSQHFTLGLLLGNGKVQVQESNYETPNLFTTSDEENCWSQARICDLLKISKGGRGIDGGRYKDKNKIRMRFSFIPEKSFEKDDV